MEDAEMNSLNPFSTTGSALPKSPTQRYRLPRGMMRPKAGMRLSRREMWARYDAEFYGVVAVIATLCALAYGVYVMRGGA
jgi:hypothetical protein